MSVRSVGQINGRTEGRPWLLPGCPGAKQLRLSNLSPSSGDAGGVANTRSDSGPGPRSLISDGVITLEIL